MSHHEGRCGDGFTYPAVVNDLEAGLETGTHERVWRAADEKAFLLGKCQHGLSVLPAGCERFLVVDALAGFQRSHANRPVSSRNREIQHDFNLGIPQQIFDCAGRNSVRFRFRLRAFWNNVSDGNNLEDAKLLGHLEIGFRDIAAPDNSNANRFHLTSPLESSAKEILDSTR
jgi:hypothetical protein